MRIHELYELYELGESLKTLRTLKTLNESPLSLSLTLSLPHPLLLFLRLFCGEQSFDYRLKPINKKLRLLPFMRKKWTGGICEDWKEGIPSGSIMNSLRFHKAFSIWQLVHAA